MLLCSISSATLSTEEHIFEGLPTCIWYFFFSVVWFLASFLKFLGLLSKMVSDECTAGGSVVLW